MFSRGMMSVHMAAGLSMLQGLFSSVDNRTNGFEHVLARRSDHSSTPGVTKALRRGSTAWGGARGDRATQVQESARRRRHMARAAHNADRREAHMRRFESLTGVRPWHPGNVGPELRRIRGRAMMRDLEERMLLMPRRGRLAKAFEASR